MFNPVLAKLLVPRPCPKCGTKTLTNDFRRAYAVGLAARVSFAADVAKRDLGIELPWKQAFVVHMLPVPTEPGVARMLATVGARKYAENVSLGETCDAFEALARLVALDLLPEQHSDARESFEAMLALRWPDADFHVCGISSTPSVKRVVEAFEGG